MTSQKKATVRGKAGESTRKMQWSRMAVGLAILLLIWLATFIYSRNVKTVLSFGLTGSLAVGAIFVIGIKLLEKKANVTIKRAKQAERGAVAEEKTGEILDGLPEGNFVVHDFDTGRGNIDHILVGPKGIFTLEVKSHRGTVTFDNGNLLRDGKPFEKNFVKQAWAECFAVREILAKWEIKEPVAEPLIVFSNAFVKVRGKANGVAVINLKFLQSYLERFPDQLSTAEAGRIYNRLRMP
ncbi:MAG: nuclease-related domain-containing protein [Candidatus Deferrimicrobium sp.]